MSIAVLQPMPLRRSRRALLCYHRRLRSAASVCMDIIYLQHLTVDTVIGVWEWERRIRQTLIFDLELGLDTRQAGETDELQYTVDYKAVTDRVRDFARDSQFKLIEALAENITRILLAEFPVQWVRLKINKQGVVRHVRDVCVIIERGELP